MKPWILPKDPMFRSHIRRIGRCSKSWAKAPLCSRVCFTGDIGKCRSKERFVSAVPTVIVGQTHVNPRLRTLGCYCSGFLCLPFFFFFPLLFLGSFRLLQKWTLIGRTNDVWNYLLDWKYFGTWFYLLGLSGFSRQDPFADYALHNAVAWTRLSLVLTSSVFRSNKVSDPETNIYMTTRWKC